MFVAVGFAETGEESLDDSYVPEYAVLLQQQRTSQRSPCVHGVHGMDGTVQGKRSETLEVSQMESL